MQSYANLKKELHWPIESQSTWNIYWHKLTWKLHIKELTKSINAQLKSLKRISYLSTKELESIYFRLIIPHKNNCISVWGNCSTAAFEPIEALHVKAARLIHRLPSSLEDYDVIKKVHWQNISNIYKKRLAFEMFQIINFDGCHRLSHMFKQVNSVRKGKLTEMNKTTSESLVDNLYLFISCLGLSGQRHKKCRNYEFFYIRSKKGTKIDGNY